MGRPLNTALVVNPTVRLADKVGSRFVGRYVGSKDITINGKPNKLYEFKALDGDALITIKDGSTYKEADIAQGDVVSVFGGKALDTAFVDVQPGEDVEIIFNGEKKLKGGRRFNDYAAAVVDTYADIKV